MNPVTPEVTTAAGAGTFLSTARLRAGISLNDLASRTRIPRSTLEALEAEDWKSLPAMVYVRGFIRSYARELGMEPSLPLRLLDGEVADARAADGQAHVDPAAAERRAAWDSIRWRAAYSVAATLILAAMLAAIFSVSPPRLEARSLEPAVDATPMPVLIPGSARIEPEELRLDLGGPEELRLDLGGPELVGPEPNDAP